MSHPFRVLSMRYLTFSLLALCFWAAVSAQAAVTPTIGIVLDPASPRAKLLAQVPVTTTPYPDVLAAMRAQPHGIVVADATPAASQSLVGHPQDVKAFTDQLTIK